MYKLASQNKLRVSTNRGALSVEQLWDLPLTELDTLAVSLETAYKVSGKKSFLVAKSKKDKILKLQFDIVLDILSTKVEAAEVAKDAAGIKEHNQKIMGLIAKKQDDELGELSTSELKKLLKS
jgi:hypothetical protein